MEENNNVKTNSEVKDAAIGVGVVAGGYIIGKALIGGAKAVKNIAAHEFDEAKYKKWKKGKNKETSKIDKASEYEARYLKEKEEESKKK